MAALRTGDCFESFDELIARIAELEAETNVKFFKSISVTIRKFLETAPGHFISKAFSDRPDKEVLLQQKKYRLIKFACTHGGRKYSGKDNRVRNTKTKKLDCPVFLSVLLDKSLRLVVKGINLEHSHPISKASFLLLPENRRLTEDEKNAARQFNDVGADKKRIRQHLLDRYGKNLTRHDLNNVLREPRSAESDLEVAVGLLRERGFTCTVVEDGGTVCGLFFQDQEMRNAYEKFPELLLMDSTYKLVDIRTPVFTILTVDSFGRGVPLAVFLVTNETAHMIGAMLRVFKEHNAAAANNTKVWLTDKDRAEKAAIAEVFPGCDQFLCSFHVLQSFRREVDLSGLDRAERDRILRILQQLVFANSDSEYSRLRGEIRHPATDRYLRDNWDGIRWEWVRGLSGAGMAGVFTNNHLESLHGKMKSVCRVNDSLPKFVLSYLVVLQTVRTDRNAEIHAETSKRPTSSCHGDLQEYQRHVTSFALSLLQEELVQAASVTLDTSQAGQQTACDRCGVVDVSPTTCSCLFRLHYALPCRHIMAVRQARQMCLFSQDLIAQKWLLSYAADHLEAQVSARGPTNPSVSTRRLPQTDPPRTERQRFRQLQNITTHIAAVGSELTGRRHRALTEKLTQLLDLLQQGRSFVVVEEVHCGTSSGMSDEPTGDKDGTDAAGASVNVPNEPTDDRDGDDGADSVRAVGNPPRDVEMPCFDLMWGEVSNSPVRPGPEQDPMNPTPSPRTPASHRPAVPSPLTRTATPDFSGRMVPRYVVLSPSRPTSPRTSSHRQSAVPRRIAIPSPSNPTSRTHPVSGSPVASVKINNARRNLWSPNAAADTGSQSSHAPSSQASDNDRVPVSLSLSPVIGGPSPVIGRYFPRTGTAAAAAASFTGPSTSGAPQCTWRDGRDVGLRHLAMPPRMTKNRGRPKGSSTTVVGSTKK